jgi:carbamoyltransferase
MTYILGISGLGHTAYDMCGIGHDPSACLLKDGKIVTCAEEERFIRVKHASGFFPYNAIKFCLDYAKIGIDDVDHIAGNFKPSLISSQYARRKMFSSPIQSMQTMLGARVIGKKYADAIRRIPYFLGQADSGIMKKVSLAEHHMAHSASSYYLSGFDRAVIMSIDASGECATTLISEIANDRIRKVRESFSPNSIGGFYTTFTEFLGFKSDDGEYKVMGLAAYGKDGINLDEMMKVDDGKVVVNPKIYGNYFRYSKYVEERFGQARKKGEPIETRHANLAYAVQKKLEETVMELLKLSTTMLSSRKLCLSGGVALNSKMNGRLLESEYIDDIFIQPASGDAGTSLGAALLKSVELGCRPRETMKHSYYGPEFSNDEIKKILKMCGSEFDYFDDISGTVSELIAKGNIIGWFQGRMEFGPRALGNRSILADPTDPKMKDRINSTIKFREEFRPFCPSILKGHEKEYLEYSYPSPFMILTFRVRDEKQKEIPAVVHVDGTARPQTVEKGTNPMFHDLIKSFESLSGVPVILNTSFNVAGEPIVCTPQDALRTFFSSGMSYLALGNYLVMK